MSKLLALCMVLIVCGACIPAASPAAGSWPAADPPGQPIVAAPRFGLTTGLAAGQPPLSLLTASQAGPTWTETIELASGWTPSRWETPQSIDVDLGVWAELAPDERLDLVTWLRRGIWFKGDWTARGVRIALQGLQMTLDALGGNQGEMRAVLGFTDQHELIYQVCADCFETGSHFSQPALHLVTFDSSPDLTSFLHETGHVVDYNLAQGLDANVTWWSEIGFLGLGWKKQVHQSGEAGVYYLDTGQDAPHSEYSPREDFADTFAAWVLEENHAPLPHGWRNPSYRRVLMLATVPGALLE